MATLMTRIAGVPVLMRVENNPVYDEVTVYEDISGDFIAFASVDATTRNDIAQGMVSIQWWALKEHYRKVNDFDQQVIDGLFAYPGVYGPVWEYTQSIDIALRWINNSWQFRNRMLPEAIVDVIDNRNNKIINQYFDKE